MCVCTRDDHHLLFIGFLVEWLTAEQQQNGIVMSSLGPDLFSPVPEGNNGLFSLFAIGTEDTTAFFHIIGEIKSGIKLTRVQ